MDDVGRKQYLGWVIVTFNDKTQKKYKDAVIDFGNLWIIIGEATETDDYHVPVRYARDLVEKVDGIESEKVVIRKKNPVQARQLILAEVYIHEKLKRDGADIFVSAAELKKAAGSDEDLSLEVLYALVQLYEHVHRVVTIQDRGIKFSGMTSQHL